MTTRRRVIVGIVVAVVGAVAWSQYWVVTGRITTVERGRLYRSAALAPDALVAFCRSHGIRTVIDLRKTSGDTESEGAALAHAGIRHVALPTGQVPDADTVRRFLAVMDDRATGPVLVHCTHGVGRTGVFAAIYRMEYQGWSSRAAIFEAMAVAGFGSFGPGNSKAAFLSAYVPRAGARPR
jgi:protein tyrosine phosphatase